MSGRVPFPRAYQDLNLNPDVQTRVLTRGMGFIDIGDSKKRHDMKGETMRMVCKECWQRGLLLLVLPGNQVVKLYACNSVNEQDVCEASALDVSQVLAWQERLL